MQRHFLLTLVLGCLLPLAGCTTVTCIETSARDPQQVAKWDVTIAKIEPENVCGHAAISLPPSRGQRITVTSSTGSQVEVVQPLPEHYQLHVGQRAVLIADHRQLWVQPADYPLPPELQVPPKSAAVVPRRETKLRLELPDGWVPTPLTDVMRSGGIISAAHNVTLDLAAELRAYRRPEITDLHAFAESLQAALASILDQPKMSAIAPATIGGRPAVQFELEGVSRRAPVDLGYVGLVIEGQDEVAYLVAWTHAAAFPSKKAALAQAAGMIAGL